MVEAFSGSLEIRLTWMPTIFKGGCKSQSRPDCTKRTLQRWPLPTSSHPSDSKSEWPSRLRTISGKAIESKAGVLGAAVTKARPETSAFHSECAVALGRA